MRINVNFCLLKSKQGLRSCALTWPGAESDLWAKQKVGNNCWWASTFYPIAYNQDNWPLCAYNCLLVNLVNLAENWRHAFGSNFNWMDDKCIKRCAMNQDKDWGRGQRCSNTSAPSASSEQPKQPLAQKVSSPDGVSDLNVDLSMVCRVCQLSVTVAVV